jgi:hypothetical protein
MSEPKLSGKPDAENLHVRFDEGRGGSFTAPLLLDWPKNPVVSYGGCAQG